MFNARQRLRLFPTPTDADWLHVGTVVSGCLSASGVAGALSGQASFYPQPALCQAKDVWLS